MAKNHIEVGDRVKYSQPQDEIEAQAVLLVTSFNDVTNRVIVEWLNSGMNINPTFCHSVNDLIHL